MSNIFEKRIELKPYEYPELIKYVDAIRQSYWIHTEFNYTPDIQDMMVKMQPHEVESLNRTMLAISQIENSVKSFWGDIHKHLPKPEISDVGFTFSESEVRHKDAYAALLEKMGLNERFNSIQQVPALKDRLAYIQKINDKTKLLGGDPKEYFKSIIFFSMLIENVSLFSQFYIILAFNKFDNVLKGMSNAVEATSKEEDCFIEGTEIMTPNGWVDFRDITDDSVVYQYTDRGNIEPVTILKRHEKDFSGNLIKFSKTGRECIVTPNHDMVFFNPAGALKKKIAKDFVGCVDKLIPELDCLSGVSSEFLKKTEVPYSGKVYCVTVPSGVIITRYGDKPFITGNCHANFGFDIINIIKKENPEWFSEDLKKYIQMKIEKAFKAEKKVLDWIYENGDLKAAPREITEEFIKHRLNQSLEAIGVSRVFEIDPNKAKAFKWFEDEITVTKNNDFFQKRSTNYTKRTKSISEEDLF